MPGSLSSASSVTPPRNDPRDPVFERTTIADPKPARRCHLDWSAALDASIEQSDDDQNQYDHEKHVNQVSRFRQPRYSRRTEVSQQPQQDEDYDDCFEHFGLLDFIQCPGEDVSHCFPPAIIRARSPSMALQSFSPSGWDHPVQRDVSCDLDPYHPASPSARPIPGKTP